MSSEVRDKENRSTWVVEGNRTQTASCSRLCSRATSGEAAQVSAKSEPRRVRRANDTTIWLENGQRWSRRRCIKHQPAIKQQIRAPSPVQPRQTDVEADDDEGPVITFQPNRLLRRSTRQHCQRDLGPVIRF